MFAAPYVKLPEAIGWALADLASVIFSSPRYKKEPALQDDMGRTSEERRRYPLAQFAANLYSLHLPDTIHLATAKSSRSYMSSLHLLVIKELQHCHVLSDGINSLIMSNFSSMLFLKLSTHMTLKKVPPLFVEALCIPQLGTSSAVKGRKIYEGGGRLKCSRRGAISEKTPPRTQCGIP